MMRAVLTLSVCLLATSAFAEDNKPSPEQQPQASEAKPQDAAPAATPEAATPAAKPKTSAHPPAAAKPKQTSTPAAKPQPAAMSQSKFLGLLYSEIAKHTPKDNKMGPGAVTANFRVNASGRIENVSITNSTSPAHAEVVKKILASVKAPPPPSGSFDASQNFKFH
jgi:outer membrane biosynthesis protein TonB